MSTDREREIETRLGVRRHELLTGLAAVAERTLADYGIEPALAELAANAVADWLADSMGGQVISFPSDTSFRLADLHLRIWDDHQARVPYDVLATRYKLSERHIRTVLKEIGRRLDRQAKARKIPPAQGDLLEL